MKILILILSLINPFASVFCQDISAEIKDSKSQLPIQYVNIGIVGKNIGTVSDTLGNFQLSLIHALNTDTLRISSIAFVTKDYNIGDLRKSNFPKIILMDEAIVQLKEVLISNEERIPFQLGLKRKYAYPIPLYKKVSTKVAFPQISISHEIGTRFKNSKTICLDSIQLNFAECHLDQLEIRLNVYAIKNEFIKNSLTQPIYISLTKADALSFPVINLSAYAIELESDFLITIENHKKIPNRSLYLLATTKSKGKLYPTYYRHSSQGNWTKLKSKKPKALGISILAFVH